MKRKTIRKGMNPALVAITEQRRDNLLIRSAAKANLLITLMVLHDKYGFGKKRIEQFLDEYYKQLEAYTADTWKKRKTLRTFCGMSVGLRLNYEKNKGMYTL